MKLNKVRQAAYDQTRELVTLRARFAAAQQENDGNKQIESDLLAMQAERDELRVTLDEALGLLQKLDTLRLREALERVSTQWHYAHPIDGRGRAAYQNCEHLDCAQARAALKAAV